MILEGIVTTVGLGDAINIAPMGPDVGEDPGRLVLKPYRTSQTYRNLKLHPEGVFHVTDDALLLAQAAIGRIEPWPDLLPANKVLGCYLANACRFMEFRVDRFDDASDRTRLEAAVVHHGRLRDFFGFNRGKHAIVEAAILATRTEFLPIAEILNEYARLETLVRKTGGPDEEQAFSLLRRYVEQKQHQ